jgi:Domain of unknown function (DUF1707)
MASRDPDLRAGDADREEVAAALREHYAMGRLTAAEFDERVDAAYTARTYGDLARLTRDLPAASPGPAARPPAQGPLRAEPVKQDRRRRGLRAAWAAWTAAVLVNVVIWVIVSASAGEPVYFWPAWVAGPWGAVLLAGTIFGRDLGESGRDEASERRRQLRGPGP